MEWERLLSRERFIKSEEDWEGTYRNDYDTIICSTLFRRLQDKAQVFPLEEDDYVRTRLTHSLEVSAIGKRLGEHVFQRLKESHKDKWFESHWEKEFSDVLLCAGLVHDIGNPPFGHFGEYAVREWFQAHLVEMNLGEKKVTELLSPGQIQDLYHFEGNAQSLRLLSRTPCLGKMGYNCAERDLFQEINRKTGMNGRRHPLSYLLEAADDIAYRTSDLEDAMVKKVLGFTRIKGELERYAGMLEHGELPGGRREICGGVRECVEKLEELYREELQRKGRKAELTAVQRWNRYLQDMMVRDGTDAFVKNYDRIMEGDFEGDLFADTVSGHIIQAISMLSEEFIYTSSVKIKTELFGRRVIDSLLGQFMVAAVKYDTKEPVTFIDRRTVDMISGFYKSMYHQQAKGKGEGDRLYLRILMVTDYISGMTDNYAKRLYNELFG